VLRPASRGHLELRTSDCADAPAIQPNYLAESTDLETLIEAVEISRTIIAAQPFDDCRGKVVFPASGAFDRDSILEFIRSKAETIYHPVGTCRMGRDAAAVVDAELRVHGVAGLRVVDASVMPPLISGNTNAPTIMIAEKIADELLTGSPQRVRADVRASTPASRDRCAPA
jgi:choline dehydrogenase